MIITYIYNGIR